jgi:hypothetical protein
MPLSSIPSNRKRCVCLVVSQVASDLDGAALWFCYYDTKLITPDTEKSLLFTAQGSYSAHSPPDARPAMRKRARVVSRKLGDVDTFNLCRLLPKKIIAPAITTTSVLNWFYILPAPGNGRTILANWFYEENT